MLNRINLTLAMLRTSVTSATPVRPICETAGCVQANAFYFLLDYIRSARKSRGFRRRRYPSLCQFSLRYDMIPTIRYDNVYLTCRPNGLFRISVMRRRSAVGVEGCAVQWMGLGPSPEKSFLSPKWKVWVHFDADFTVRSRNDAYKKVQKIIQKFTLRPKGRTVASSPRNTPLLMRHKKANG